MPTIAEVQRVAADDRKAIGESIARGEPMLIAGGARDWPIRCRWTRGALRQRFGSAPVTYRKAPGRVHPAISPDGTRLLSEDRQASLAELLDLIETSPDIFLDANLVALDSRSQAVNGAFAALRDDIAPPDWIDPKAVDTIGLWLSGAGARTRLHYDRNGLDNFNAQIAGRKAVRLVSPDNILRLRPYPLTGPVFNFAGCDEEGAEDAVSGCDMLTACLEEGDILFIPAFWFHALDHLGAFNFNINFWCDPRTIPLNPTSLRQEAGRVCALALEAAALQGELRDRIVASVEAACLGWAPSRTPSRYSAR